MIKAVIFDVDDVLLNVYERGIRNFQSAAERLGIRVPSYEEFTEVWDHHWAYIVQHFWPETDVDEFQKFYEQMNFDGYPLIEGALEAIQFASLHYTTGVLTSRTRKSLEKRAMQVGLNLDLFNFVVTIEDVEYQKPDPRAFGKVLKELSKRGISPQEALYVGNGKIDYIAAVGAGLLSVTVLTGPTSRRNVEELGIDKNHVLKSVAHLSEFLMYEMEGQKAVIIKGE